jgi:hypothetical protein
MRNEIVLTGRIKAGKLQLRGRNRFGRECKEMADGEVVLTLRKLRATRSAAANAYYWGVIVAMLMTRIKGMTEDDIHEYVLKPLFLSKKGAAVDGNGEIVGEFVVGGSTKALNKNEFYEYCERIRQWAAEKLELDIPDPDVDWRDKRSTEAA